MLATLSERLAVKAGVGYFHAAIPALPGVGGVRLLAMPSLLSRTPAES